MSQNPRGKVASVEIDVNKLRDYMAEELFGAAFCCDLPGALIDLPDVETMDPHALCQKAERMGIDSRKFEVR